MMSIPYSHIVGFNNIEGQEITSILDQALQVVGFINDARSKLDRAIPTPTTYYGSGETFSLNTRELKDILTTTLEVLDLNTRVLSHLGRLLHDPMFQEALEITTRITHY